jgi:hypothetical protein
MSFPSTFEGFRLYPVPGEEPEELGFRQWHGWIIDKIGGLPFSYTSYPGQVVVVNSSGGGITTAGLSGLESVNFAGLGVVGWITKPVILTGSTGLNQTAHGGRVIDMANGSAAVLTLGKNANPALGLGEGFSCEVYRPMGGAAVSISLVSPLVNRNPDGHTAISEGGLVRIRIRGDDVLFHGYTA